MIIKNYSSFYIQLFVVKILLKSMCMRYKNAEEFENDI